MSIFGFANLIAPAAAKPAVVISNPPPAQLSYAVFYVGGTTFNGTYGKFVRS